MKIRFIEDGNFSGWVRTILLVIGLLIIFVACKYVPPAPYGGFLVLLGLGVAAVGGYASRAHLLKIKPFDNSCKRARKSYESDCKEGGVKK
ncbi:MULTISPECIES: hypothetical protein [Burkholderia]|uniref:hypothetical protein n=1 Tax=Burkholderia TaxID=32008 RepID=UPI00117791D4|nr:MULTISPECIES: hypothetical protein [Burkholderia]MBY4722639.1 hypothetical protein [Burkholderia contaminans]MCI3974470.1 hypothetical protein [Burkholderia sp. HI4860]MDN7789196.1 hypothetical protein [Burkholderia contaminans]